MSPIRTRGFYGSLTSAEMMRWTLIPFIVFSSFRTEVASWTGETGLILRGTSFHYSISTCRTGKHSYGTWLTRTVVASRTAIEHRARLSSSRIAHEALWAWRTAHLIISAVLSNRADSKLALIVTGVASRTWVARIICSFRICSSGTILTCCLTWWTESIRTTRSHDSAYKLEASRSRTARTFSFRRVIASLASW